MIEGDSNKDPDYFEKNSISRQSDEEMEIRAEGGKVAEKVDIGKRVKATADIWLALDPPAQRPDNHTDKDSDDGDNHSLILDFCKQEMPAEDPQLLEGLETLMD